VVVNKGFFCLWRDEFLLFIQVDNVLSIVGEIKLCGMVVEVFFTDLPHVENVVQIVLMSNVITCFPAIGSVGWRSSMACAQAMETHPR